MLDIRHPHRPRVDRRVLEFDPHHQWKDKAVTLLHCYVDDATLEILRRVSAETGREIEELAESAIAEAAIASQRPVNRERSS